MVVYFEIQSIGLPNNYLETSQGTIDNYLKEYTILKSKQWATEQYYTPNDHFTHHNNSQDDYKKVLSCGRQHYCKARLYFIDTDSRYSMKIRISNVESVTHNSSHFMPSIIATLHQFIFQNQLGDVTHTWLSWHLIQIFNIITQKIELWPTHLL